jgi:hypothetical protein
MIVGVSLAQDGTPPIVGPDHYPEGINPLTGLVVDDPTLLDRRPLIVKISNFPAFVRESQIGLNEAEIVWEHLLAGGVTRFSAVFYATDLEKVGPIRSGRLVDFELTRMYRSLFAFSGMAQGANDVLFRDALMVSRVVGGSGPCPPFCRYPQEGIALEHTLFGDTAAIRTDYATERGADLTAEPIYGMAFSDTTPAGGLPLDTLRVRYSETVSEWDWDAETERWLHLQDGEAHIQGGTGDRVAAKNIVVIEEEHTVQPFVSENYWGPGDFAFSVNFIGSGRVLLLRDGRYWAGEWRRATREEPLSFYDLDGNVFPFTPGNTFFNLVPLWIDGYELELIPPDAPQAVVNGDTGVSMRFGPNAQYVSPDVAYPLDAFALIGRKFDKQWLQVLRRGEDRAVWLPIDRLDLPANLDLDALPIPRPSNERG